MSEGITNETSGVDSTKFCYFAGDNRVGGGSILGHVTDVVASL